MNFIILFLGSFFCLNLNSCSNNSAGIEMKSDDIPQKLMDTTFVSKFVNDSIKVDVSLPSDYNSYPSKKFKVIYIH